jgi:hypothetical protein
MKLNASSVQKTIPDTSLQSTVLLGPHQDWSINQSGLRIMLENFQLPIERTGQPEIVVIQEAHVF